MNVSLDREARGKVRECVHKREERCNRKNEKVSERGKAGGNERQFT